MSKLVICEKPSVAKSIASALGVTSRADGYFEGGGWLISWCIGHLVGLADAAAYNDRYKKWRYEDLPILPDPFRYVVSEEKADQFHILRSLMERPDVMELVSVPVEPENPLRTAELTLEDDYGMIDGIINNGRRGEELEKAQAEARRTTPEKKPSIREQLEDAKRECGSRKGPDKPAPQKKPPELGDL